MQKLWDLCNLNSIGFWLTADLKVVNMVCGLNSHAASFPCPYCLWPKGSKEEKSWPHRTFAQIRENNEKWIAAGGKANHVKKYFNCCHKLLFVSDGEVLFTIPPPSLHLLMGLLNTLYGRLVDDFPLAEE